MTSEIDPVSLLKAPENLTGKQAQTLQHLTNAADGEVWRACTLKQAVRGIFEHGLTVQDVTVLIDRFMPPAARSRLRLGQTIHKHRQGILAAVRLGDQQCPNRHIDAERGVFSYPEIRGSLLLPPEV